MTADGQIFLIGDSHIGLSTDDEVPMVKWLARLEALKPRAFYLDGDIFHYLIGDPKFITSSVTKFFARLRELRDHGTSVHYVEGNRDFFLEGSVAAESVSELCVSTSFQAGSKRYLVVHGDMINDRDHQYRFWRRASKNPVTRFGVRLFPKRAARRFVDSVEKRLSRSNFKHKYRLPIELMEAYGRARAAEGYDVIVFGHFHEKTIVPAGTATVVVLPAWFESGEAMAVDPDTGDYTFVHL
jgi:UDP-2,3-diacylglucosamine pyrophosphatase LpxH